MISNRVFTPKGKRSFNKEAYDLFDKRCKEEGIQLFLDCFKIKAEENPFQYDVDLLLYIDNTLIPTGYCEVEIRNIWNSDEFPYDTVSIPYRKKKWFESHSKAIFFFLVFNKYFDRALIARVSTILDKSKIYTGTSKFGNTETFYRLDKSYFLPAIKVQDKWLIKNPGVYHTESISM